MYRCHLPTLRPGLAATAPIVAAFALTVLVAAPAAAGNHVVNVRDNFFDPDTLTIQAGDTVTWNHAGNLPHNVRANDSSFRCADGCEDTGGNGNPSTGWSFSRTFNNPGEIGYRCDAHGFAMSGLLTVQGGGGNPGALQFSNGSYTVGEGDGSRTITVQRTGGDDGAVSVQFATSNGSASAGSDYTPASGTLSWANGDDASKTFTVQILEDTIDEPNQTVNLTLSAPTGGAVLGSPSTAVLTIADNDESGPAPTPGSLSFTAPAQNAPEGGGALNVQVQRTGGTSGTVSVQYDSTGGSATAGDDYTAVTGILSWAGGDGSAKSFQLPILDDSDAEGNETVTLALSAPTGGATVGSPANQTVTILDDDAVIPNVCVEDATTLCLLGGRFRVEVTFTPPGGTLQPANAIPFTDRAGLFWFFNPNNVEMLVKLQNACVPAFDRYWVFFAATTNVQFEVVVTDTEALRQKRYSNPQGMVALPVADTQAFETCP